MREQYSVNFQNKQKNMKSIKSLRQIMSLRNALLNQISTKKQKK